MQNSATTGERRPANASRDRELIHYVGRHGLVTINHVMAAMEVGQAITYRRVARCIEAGLLERHAILASEPSVLRATQAGLKFAGLPFPVASISPGRVEHYLRCASVAHALEAKLKPGDRLRTEPEIRLIEQLSGSHEFSVDVGRLPNGKRRYHRPDLLHMFEEGGRHRAIAIEVELTLKAPQRLRQIMRGWRYTRNLAEVHYYCAPDITYLGVKRALEATGARSVVKVFEGLPE